MGANTERDGGMDLHSFKVVNRREKLENRVRV